MTYTIKIFQLFNYTLAISIYTKFTGVQRTDLLQSKIDGRCFGSVGRAGCMKAVTVCGVLNDYTTPDMSNCF